MRAAGRERACFAAAGALCAWTCQAGDLSPLEALASGQAPAELRLCPAEAPDGGGCSAFCGGSAGDGWVERIGSASEGDAAAAVVELDDELVVFGDRGASSLQLAIRGTAASSGSLEPDVITTTDETFATSPGATILAGRCSTRYVLYALLPTSS